MSPRVLLATAAQLPAGDLETPRIVDALAGLGIDAAIESWSDPDVGWARADAVIVRSTWDYTEHLDDFLCWADAVAPAASLWNPARVLRWNAHKRYLVELAASGLSVVPTTLLAAGEDQAAIEAALQAAGPGLVVVKPAVDAGARGARCGAAGDPTLAAHAAALVAAGDVLVQPHMAQIAEEGELSVVVLRGVPLLARRKLPADGDFRVHEHHGGRTVAVPLDDELVAFAEAALALVDEPLLYARVDAVRHEGSLHLMELELIEPLLYLDTDDEVHAAATAIASVLG